MSNCSDKENALVLTFEVERLSRLYKLPLLCIVHCPDTGEFVRSSSSLKGNLEACKAFQHVTADYLQIVSHK